MLKNRAEFLFTLIIFLLFLEVFKIKAIDLSSLSPTKINDYLRIPESKTNEIIFSLAEYFGSEWYNSIAFDFPPENQAILNIMRNLSIEHQLQYLFFELPADTAWKILNITFNIAKEYLKTSNFELLDKLELLSVDLIQKKVLNLILENEIKLTPGAIDISYLNQNNQWQNVTFQYILISQKYQNEEEIFIRFFSPYQLNPPANKGSIGLSIGYASCLSGKIPPFIVDIKGKWSDEKLAKKKWIEGPEIKISFPEDVPDFGLKTQGFLERNIITPFKESIKKFFADLETGGPLKIFFTSKENKEVKRISIPGLDKIKSFLFSFPIFEGEATKNISEYLAKENGVDSADNKNNKENELENIFISKDENTDENILFQNEQGQNQKAPLKNEEENILSTSNLDKSQIQKEEASFCSLPPENAHLFSQVIFNEIAWMGNKESSDNEWIELKNISGKSQNLNNWKIQNKNEKIKIILKETVLSPGNFFLLERTDDNTLPQIKADQIFTGAITNSNEVLFLFDQNCNVQDIVSADPNWPAGDNITKRTMERKKFDLSWQTSENPGGTPRAENSFGYFSKKESNTSSTSQNKDIQTNQTQTSKKSNIGSGIINAQNAGQSEIICTIESGLQPKYFPIIFNELVWMGTNSNSYDEWIELKNISTNTVNLRNWQILGRKIGQSDLKMKIIIDKEFNILPNQFFFLEKNNSAPAFLNLADLNYTGSLLADDDPNFELYLFDENCNLIDKIIATSSWPAGKKNPERRSMERNKNLEWYTNNSTSSINGLFCTPKEENSVFQESKNPDLLNINPTSTNNLLAANIVISEVNIKNNEFVELYNPTENEIPLSNYYLVYFSGKENTTSEELLQWNKPYQTVQLPSTTLPAISYFLIALDENSTTSGLPAPDFETSSIKLNDDKGSIGIFSCNPKTVSTSEEAINCKIDLFSWQNNQKYSVISEGTSYFFKNSDIKNKSFQRKKETNFYIDNNENFTDFEINFLTPTNSKGNTGNLYPPEAPQNFNASISSDNSILLTWSPSSDPDIFSENISYFIFYSKNFPITKDNAANSKEIFSTTTTNTQIIISDLFYDSTYYFGILAFDGLNFSEITTTSVEIPAEIPQWQMFSGDNFNTFKSPYIGPTTSTIKWALYWPKDEIGDITTGPVIDQNGTIYLGENTDLVAISKEGKIKWKYSCEKIIGTPLIGKDGSIYFTTLTKIFSVSPEGKLNWKIELKNNDLMRQSNEQVDQIGKISLQLVNNKLYFLSYKNNQIENQNEVSTTQAVLISINLKTGEIEKEIDLPLEEEKYLSLEAKNPVIVENTIFIPIEKTIFAIDLETGDHIWKKTFLNDNFNDKIFALAFDPQSKNLVVSFSQPAQNLYFVSPENGSTSLAISENCDICKSFFLLSDENGNIFSSLPVSGWTRSWLQAYDSNGAQLWQFGPYNYQSQPAGYFLYPLAISKEGILYAPIQGGLFAIGE